MKGILRRIHEAIVKRYIPDDDQPELAKALFVWKYGKEGEEDAVHEDPHREERR
jgi:hypothetical protein